VAVKSKGEGKIGMGRLAGRAAARAAGRLWFMPGRRQAPADPAYHFRNIGGTSTGAIAAAFTAAAEHGRDSDGGGYTVLEGLPQWFGQPSGEPGKHNLLALFKPTEKTAPLLNILLKIIRSDYTVLGIYWHTIYGAALHLPLTTFVGALPGLLILLLAVVDGGGGTGAARSPTGPCGRAWP